MNSNDIKKIACSKWGRYKVLGKNARLPAEYQEVEYIESTGTQRIDTGVVGQNLFIDIDFQVSSQSITNSCVFGTRSFGQHYNILTLLPAFFIWQGTGQRLGGRDENWHNFRTDNTGVYFDNVYINNDTDTSGASSNLFLFASNNTNTYNSYAKIKKCILKDKISSNIVRYFVPCYHKTTQVIGMYDLVSKQFFTNVGTGTFNKGNDVIYNVTSPLNFYKNATLVKTLTLMKSVDLGTLAWLPNGGRFDGAAPIDIKPNTEWGAIPNISCLLYKTEDFNRVYAKTIDKSIGFINGTFEIWDSDKQDMTYAEFRASMSGVILFYEPATPLTLSSGDYWFNQTGKTSNQTLGSLLLPKGITKITDANGVEVEYQVLNDSLNFSNRDLRGKATPTTSGEKIITKGFTSGGEHFTQLYIYADGEVWYVNGGSSAQAFASGVWEIEYKQIKFDANVILTAEELNALLGVYDLILYNLI